MSGSPRPRRTLSRWGTRPVWASSVIGTRSTIGAWHERGDNSGMSRVDAHHHIWDLTVREQTWMVGPELDTIRRNFSIDDLAPQAAAADITATVLVQTVGLVDETVEFLEVAASNDLVAGVVGWVDLTDPDVASTLAGLLERPD